MEAEVVEVEVEEDPEAEVPHVVEAEEALEEEASEVLLVVEVAEVEVEEEEEGKIFKSVCIFEGMD